MVNNKGVLSLVCCLLLATAFSLPLAAQSTPAPQSDVNRDPNLSTPAPSDQYNSQPATAPESQPSDLEREKPADPSVQPDQESSDSDRSDADRELPATATGMPLVGLIGAASLFGAAIRHRYF